MLPEEIINQYGLNISKLSKRMIPEDDLAKEATQEVWFEVFKNIDSFRGNSKLSTWIYTIAKRTILRYIKNERIVTHEDLDYCISKGQITYEGEEESKKEWIKEKCDDCVTGFNQCLTKDARLIFLFRENLDLPYSEISLIMDMSEDNVRKVASRSLKKVRSFMTNDCILLNPHGRCGCRIRKVINSTNYEETYIKIQKAYRLFDFYKKMDKELPRKNYWEKYLSETVTK